MANLTWESIKSFDDIISPEERRIILNLEGKGKTRCPYLRKDGKFFYYCGVSLPKVADKKLEPTNPTYQKHVDLVGLQLYCTDRYRKCCSFPIE